MIHPTLKRDLGLWAAVWMGLGSILGTGVFVTLATATQVAGSGVMIAIVIAALVATCNGLNAAQLAANHPVSGGTYEYGYRYLNPVLGFSAGWLFLLAKSASAATAALGFAGYLSGLGVPSHWSAYLPIGAVAAMTIVVLMGIKRANWINTAIVSVTLIALLCFIGLGLIYAVQVPSVITSSPAFSVPDLLQSSALMFVAFTGYGRITTMGEEVSEPRTTIPLAIKVTLGISTLLYLSVGGAGILTGIDNVLPTTAPLSALLTLWGNPLGAWILSVGAITAMLGVLLNLILGLSRIVLAMGRRGDFPPVFAQLNPSGTTPVFAVLGVGTTIGLLTLLGNVKTTWSFSAFNVLVYYAITNGAALQLSPSERLFPVWLPAIGLVSCVFLSFWVDWRVWLTGCGLILAGWAGRTLLRRFSSPGA